MLIVLVRYDHMALDPETSRPELRIIIAKGLNGVFDEEYSGISCLGPQSKNTWKCSPCLIECMKPLTPL